MTALLWILYIFLAILLFYVLVLAVSALFVDTSRLYRKESPFYRFLLNSFTFIAVKVLRIRMHVTGLEKIPEKERFLLVGNHLSNFDPILQWYVLSDKQMAFISKKENLNIPVFGRIVRRCCFMDIDRENPRNAYNTVISASELIKNGTVSVGVYPEGTRNKNGGLLPFHNGVFKIAKKSDCPVLVAKIRGTEEIHRNFPLHSSDVYLDFVDLIPAEFVRSHTTSEIGERVMNELKNDDGNTVHIGGNNNEKIPYTV